MSRYFRRLAQRSGLLPGGRSRQGGVLARSRDVAARPLEVAQTGAVSAPPRPAGDFAKPPLHVSAERRPAPGTPAAVPAEPAMAPPNVPFTPASAERPAATLRRASAPADTPDTTFSGGVEQPWRAPCAPGCEHQARERQVPRGAEGATTDSGEVPRTWVIGPERPELSRPELSPVEGVAVATSWHMPFDSAAGRLDFSAPPPLTEKKDSAVETNVVGRRSDASRRSTASPARPATGPIAEREETEPQRKSLPEFERQADSIALRIGSVSLQVHQPQAAPPSRGPAESRTESPPRSNLRRYYVRGD
jgi:hypothetical protein